MQGVMLSSRSILRGAGMQLARNCDDTRETLRDWSLSGWRQCGICRKL